MSRDIKFRQWSEESNRFFYWGRITEGTFASPTTQRGLGLETPDQQYTGLKDKNGVEIYEGDILRIPKIPTSIIVEYDNAAFVANASDYKEGKPNLADLINDSPFQFEIIGNIYENPELIKENL